MKFNPGLPRLSSPAPAEAAHTRGDATTTIDADGTVTRKWKPSEGYHTMCTGIPDPGPVTFTPHASVPIAAKERS